LAVGSKRRGALRGCTAVVGDDVWAEAKRQARELDKVLDGSGLRRALTARAAAELNLTTRQVYNLLQRYAVLRTIASLLPRRRGLRAKRLSAGVEAIVAATLKEKWMVKEAPPLAPIVDEIRARCAATGERPPSYVSVQRRLGRWPSARSTIRRPTSNSSRSSTPSELSSGGPTSPCSSTCFRERSLAFA